MADHFHEEVVVKHKRLLQEVLYVLANILMVVSGVLAIFWFNVFTSTIFQGLNLYVIIMLLLTGGVCAGLFFYRDKFRTEYDYTFTNGDLDFAVIYNNKKRKSLGTMRVKNVDSFGPVNSENFRRLIETPKINRRNWFLNREANLYYFYYKKEENQNIIILEPSDLMVELIRKYLPQGAYKE